MGAASLGLLPPDVVARTSAVGGWSLGGLVALELAAELGRQNDRLPHVLLIDSVLAPATGRDDRDSLSLFVADLERTLDCPLTATRASSSAARLDTLLEELCTLDLAPADADREWIERRLAVFDANARAAAAYPPRHYAGPVTLALASQRPGADETAAAWAAVATVEVHRLPADHYSILAEPQVEELAACVRPLATRDAVPIA